MISSSFPSKYGGLYIDVHLIYNHNTPLPAPSHQAIYIQTRYSTQDDFLLPSQKRRKPSSHHQIGQDYKTLSNNTTIAQPDMISLIYLAKDLHCRTHGSVGMNEITNRKFILDTLQVPNDEISPKSANSTSTRFQT